MKKETEVVPSFNPATGRKFAEVPMATGEEVVLAQAEMRQAFGVWRRKSIKDRIRILRQFQALIIDSLDTITETINQDTGKSRQDGLIEVMMTVDRLHQYYRRAPDWLASQKVPPGLYPFRRYTTEPRPYGVVAVIAPWNYPFELMISPLCSALLAGNTVLLKPSEVAAVTGKLVEQLIQSVPELSPFVRVLHGDGRVGEALVKSGPDLVFLTGSTATGRKVARAAAEQLIPYAFELGGKDPMIVLEDADIRAAARWGAWGSYYNTGQTCHGIERVYVVESVYESFVREVVARTKELKVGYSTELNNPCHVSSLAFDRQKQVVEEHLQDALAKGARILIGGESEGLFVKPTVVVDVDHTMILMKEETFGPIMPIMKVKDEAEAIRLANDSSYGLSASVWSKNHERARRVAQQLEVGSVNINDAMAHYAVSLLPFGGVKQSGSSRTHGRQDVLQFTQYRSYAVGRPPLPFDLATKMREPGHYRLGAAIMRLAFGVTPRQRVQPIVEEIEQIKRRSRNSTPLPMTVAGLAAGLLAGTMALLLSWRRQRN